MGPAMPATTPALTADQLTSVEALRELYGPKRGRSARKAMPRLMATPPDSSPFHPSL